MHHKPSAAPLVSIVMPTYQCEGWMRGALDALAMQTERDFEVVVSDGASRDASVAVAESYRDRLPALTVLSRPDQGIYDAINLAIAQCRGRWVYVLGADDKLHVDATLAQVAAVLRQTTATFVYGDVRVIGRNAMVADGARYGGPFTMARLMGQNICHQAIFTRRELFDRLGGYRLHYRLWADWDFAQRAFVREQTQWMDIVVADYAATGTSSGAQDLKFQQDRPARLRALWLARPLSLAVPLAVLRQAYWDCRKRRQT